MLQWKFMYDNFSCTSSPCFPTDFECCLWTKAGGTNSKDDEEEFPVVTNCPKIEKGSGGVEQVHSRNQNVISFNNKSTVLYIFTWKKWALRFLFEEKRRRRGRKWFQLKRPVDFYLTHENTFVRIQVNLSAYSYVGNWKCVFLFRKSLGESWSGKLRTNSEKGFRVGWDETSCQSWKFYSAFSCFETWKIEWNSHPSLKHHWLSRKIIKISFQNETRKSSSLFVPTNFHQLSAHQTKFQSQPELISYFHHVRGHLKET